MARRHPQDKNQDIQAGHIDLSAAPRVVQALRLRRLGYTYDQIAQECGYSNASGARKAVVKASRSIIRDEAQELVNWQLDRLDAALQVVMTRIEVNDPQSLDAVERLVPLLKRQAELMALDKQRTEAQQTNVRRIYEHR